jgi:hypothetical protein
MILINSKKKIYIFKKKLDKKRNTLNKNKKIQRLSGH